MSTPNVFARRALKRFEKAVRDDENLVYAHGSGVLRKEANSAVEEELKKAKRHLMNFLPPAPDVGFTETEFEQARSGALPKKIEPVIKAKPVSTPIEWADPLPTNDDL